MIKTRKIYIGKYLDFQWFFKILILFMANFEKEFYPAENWIFKYSIWVLQRLLEADGSEQRSTRNRWPWMIDPHHLHITYAQQQMFTSNSLTYTVQNNQSVPRRTEWLAKIKNDPIGSFGRIAVKPIRTCTVKKFLGIFLRNFREDLSNFLTSRK